MITDAQRVEFMNKLVASVRSPKGVLLSEWENEFVASFIRFPHTGFFIHFGGPSIGRQQAVDRMWMRYGGEVNHPHPMDSVPERPTIPNADPAGCQYIIRDDGRQRRCNEPATCQDPGQLRYCQMHGEAVVKAMKQMNRTMRLINFRGTSNAEHRTPNIEP